MIALAGAATARSEIEMTGEEMKNMLTANEQQRPDESDNNYMEWPKANQGLRAVRKFMRTSPLKVFITMSPGFMSAGQAPVHFPSCTEWVSPVPAIGGSNRPWTSVW